tara:strand:- start:767 stop:1801 length:1035 start_codon:yes stop_codon:yes gene_type:complete
MVSRFVLYKDRIKKQYDLLKELGVRISYSYKTNKEVGDLLQKSDCQFSIHREEEIDMIDDKEKIWFFPQAQSEEEFVAILGQNVRKFVVDNEIDLRNLLSAARKSGRKVEISLRMRFLEHRVGSGRYFVYGLSAKRVNELIEELDSDKRVDGIGVHVHRKSQNVVEWNILDEIKDSLSEDSLSKIKTVNLGGGLPVKYKTYTSNVLPYIFEKIKEVSDFLKERGIETYIEPGRFIAAPAIELETRIKQVQGKTIILDCSIYNCALDTMVTGIRMLVKGELDEKEKGEFYLIKGNSPTRDDIFRYKVKLKDPKVGDKIVFLNAGAYNYTTDFCGFEKLETIEKSE